jgi:hypothetical protein
LSIPETGGGRPVGISSTPCFARGKSWQTAAKSVMDSADARGAGINSQDSDPKRLG